MDRSETRCIWSQRYVADRTMPSATPPGSPTMTEAATVAVGAVSEGDGDAPAADVS